MSFGDFASSEPLRYASFCALCRSPSVGLVIISHLLPFVKRFSQTFFEVFSGFTRPSPSHACPLVESLFIISHPPHSCQYLFRFYFPFFLLSPFYTVCPPRYDISVHVYVIYSLLFPRILFFPRKIHDLFSPLPFTNCFFTYIIYRENIAPEAAYDHC